MITKTRRRSRTGASAGITALLGIAAGSVLAFGGATGMSPLGERQPEPPRADEGGAGLGVLGRDAMRERLTEALDEVEAFGERVRVAIEELDAGARPIEVLNLLRRPGDDDRDVRGRMGRRMMGEMFGSGLLGGPGDTLFDRGRSGLEGGGPRGPDDSAMGGPFRGEMTEEQLERVRAMIAERLPVLERVLAAAREQGPEAERDVLRRVGGRVMGIVMLARRDPAFADLKIAEVQTGFAAFAAAEAFRSALEAGDEASIVGARSALEDALASAFDARIEVQREEVRRLEERLARVKGDLDRRLGARDEEIGRKLDEIESGDLRERWFGPGGRGRRPGETGGDRPARP